MGGKFKNESENGGAKHRNLSLNLKCGILRSKMGGDFKNIKNK